MENQTRACVKTQACDAVAAWLCALEHLLPPHFGERGKCQAVEVASASGHWLPLVSCVLAELIQMLSPAAAAF